MEKRFEGKEMVKVIDNKIIVPECERVLELMSEINKKTTRRDIKEIANIVFDTTTEWLYADTTLRVSIEFLCISPIGDREHLLNTVAHVVTRLNEIINDPSEFGKLPWKENGNFQRMEFKPPFNINGDNNRCECENTSISHVHVKNEEADIDKKMHEALNRTYSQNLEDWE